VKGISKCTVLVDFFLFLSFFCFVEGVALLAGCVHVLYYRYGGNSS